MDPSLRPPPSNRDNDVAGQGAFSLFCHLHEEVKSVQRFVPLVVNYANTQWSHVPGVSQPRASILGVTDHWQGPYTAFVGIPDEGRNTSQQQQTFDKSVNRRVSARRYGVHKVQVLGNKSVALGELALLGPAIHTPNPRIMGKGDENNPYVGVYPIQRRTVFFPRNDEFEFEVTRPNAPKFAVRCAQHCPWTLLPALAAEDVTGAGADLVGTFQPLYTAQKGKPDIAEQPVFVEALNKEFQAIKDLTIKEAHAIYQWMMTSQVIGVFLSPASAQSWAQILLM